MKEPSSLLHVVLLAAFSTGVRGKSPARDLPGQGGSLSPCSFYKTNSHNTRKFNQNLSFAGCNGLCRGRSRVCSLCFCSSVSFVYLFCRYADLLSKQNRLQWPRCAPGGDCKSNRNCGGRPGVRRNLRLSPEGPRLRCAKAQRSHMWCVRFCNITRVW